MTLTCHPFLVPWSCKSRAITLLPLWAVRLVQCLSGCTRVHFAFFTLPITTSGYIVNKDNNIVLFADDTSIIITGSNRQDFNINANQMFQNINTWFNINLLTLNFNKSQYLGFRTKNYYNVNTQIKYDQECITNATEIKFLGLTLDDTLSWKQYIEQVINKICFACYALRNIKHIVPVDTLRVICFAHIHSIISYGIIFWGSSYYANKVFIHQKKIIRIITNTRPRDSCREACQIWLQQL